MDLTIIFPVYNVEKYIRPSLESIYRQGIDEQCFEVIIVNDGSTDNSMEMITDIIQQHSNITVINQDNQGLSVARNNGIMSAKGDYIFMPDSDDLLIENSLAKLLNLAIENKVDLVVADFLMMQSEILDEFKLNTIKQKDGKITEKTGKELFLQDLNPTQCFVWRTLFRRAFLLKHHLVFIPGIRYQDVPFTHECYLKANKCLRVSWLLNIYRMGRVNAATSSFDKRKAMDMCIAIANTWSLTNMDGLSSNIIKKLKDDVFASFSLVIYATAFYINNTSDKKAIIKFLKQEAPNLSFSNGSRQKASTFLYKVMPYALIFIRYLYGKMIEETARPIIRRLLRKCI